MSATIETLTGIRKTFTSYVGGLGLVLLTRLVQVLSGAFGLETGPLSKIAGLPMRVEYASVVVGVLFLVLLLVLHLKFRRLVLSLRVECVGDKRSRASLLQDVRFFPWIASPVQASRLSRRLFWTLTALGFLVVGRLAYAHLSSEVTVGNAWAFKAEGIIELAVIPLGLALVWRIRKNVRKILDTVSEGLDGT